MYCTTFLTVEPTGPVLRIYAWLAVVAWLGGIPAILLIHSNDGTVSWPLVLFLAAAVPLVPLILRRGSRVLGVSLPGLGARPVTGIPRGIDVTVTVIVMAALVYVAWAAYSEGVARERVHEFVRSAGDEAVVVVDGKTLPPDRARGLLKLLEAIGPKPLHHTHPTDRFPLLLRAGDRVLRLELGRDNVRRQEYWVFLPDEDHMDQTKIGRITTPLLDDLVPSGAAGEPR